ncbi:MAG: ribonucleoside-diphosphate reductase subunit alpha, partial [Alicyclobacillus sp.]|nr:ribonucleoside-diphosphate reductase subunit alpha [Alicyclobacillus sp.]
MPARSSQNGSAGWPSGREPALEAGRARAWQVDLQDLLRQACEGLTGCDPHALWEAARPQLRADQDVREWVEVLMRTAVELTTAEAPDWQYAAGRLLLFACRLEAALQGGGHGTPEPHGAVEQHDERAQAAAPYAYGDFAALVRRLERAGRYGSYIRERYSDDELSELGRYIRPERDFFLTYAGVRQLVDRYLIRADDGSVAELPQQMFMGVAMHLAMNERDRVGWAKRWYDMLSRLEATVATPTLCNARKPHPQLSSCFIDMPQDDLISIYDTDKAFARVSKFGGGMGIYVGKIRARGSAIRNHPGASGGVIPWVKNFNNTAVSCNQLGVRRGAVAVYLDVWHKDILDFLELRTNNGDERMKAHDIFPAVCVPDLFMQAVEAREPWYLFCPHEVGQVMGFRLEDAWGEEFERRYRACVAHPGLSRTEVPAMEVMKRIMRSAYETGTPFVFFRDTVNRMNPNSHAGMIYGSNLCTEIAQNMSPAQQVEERLEDGEIVIRYRPGDFVVCNLASLNLGRCADLAAIERTVNLLVRALDNAIDLNHYPLRQAEVTNRTYRAIGLGVSGYHQYLAQRGIPWESEAHVEEADRLFEWIHFFAIRASMELAQERGPYARFAGSDWQTGRYFELRGYRTRPGGPDWDGLRTQVARHGVRNGYLLAVAPTSSTSLIAGSTAGVDPVFARFFLEEKKNGVIPQTAPGLNRETFWYYKEAHTLDQRWSIRAAAARQRHIDQSQSLNLY